MGVLSERKIEIVRTLVEAAPDKIVGDLQLALARSGDDSVLSTVRDLVEIEAADRALRNMVLESIMPLCVTDGSQSGGVAFPARIPGFLWRALKANAPREVAAAARLRDQIEATPEGQRPTATRTAFDQLTRLAASGLRTSQVRDFRLAAELCDRARPGGAEALAACLDLAPVLRQVTLRLPDWLAHANDDNTAAARLAYKDAVAISEDAGPRFFEMLAGQITPHWMVLRIISAVMDKPTERYLADSELGGFAERVMDEADRSLAAIGRLDVNDGAEAGRAAGRLAELITDQVTELELYIELTRESGWGLRIFNQKKALASLAERILKETEKVALAALPADSGVGRARKASSRLEGPPDQTAVTRAMTLLSFSDQVRSCANYAGFSAAHARLTEKLGPAIDRYVEEVINQLRSGGPDFINSARAHLRVAADFCELVRDAQSADLIRRRAVNACHVEATSPDARPQEG